MKKNTNYENWHYQHAEVWKIMPSPARPSNGEQNIFYKYVNNYQKEKNKKIKLLILGSTPEFRDIFNDQRFEVTCIDINEPIYKALTLLQKKVNNKEKFIKDNWLYFNNKEKYDVIIGDAITAMFSLEYYNKLFENMSNHLVKNGLLILRVPYQDENFNIPIKMVMNNYRNRFKLEGVNIYTATFNYMVMNYLKNKKSSISLKYLGSKINELYKDNAILEIEFNELNKYYQGLTLELYYPEEKVFIDKSKKYFNVIAKEFSLDYITSMSNPMYILTKRSSHKNKYKEE